VAANQHNAAVLLTVRAWQTLAERAMLILTMPTDLAELGLEHFIQWMGELGQRRAYFMYQGPESGLVASHPELQALAEQLRSLRDFREHEAIFLEVGPETKTLQSAFIHKSRRGQAAGGVRHWPYHTLEELLRDGLRLSLGMGRKSALAGLWWGGGKGVIAQKPGAELKDTGYRRALYREYGSFITSLRGCYVTAEDAGTRPEDMAEIFRTTRFVTCIPPEFGGSGNPSVATATGVVCAMEAALDFLGLSSLQGKRICVQGLGNVGSSLIQQLMEKGVGEVLATDISPSRTESARVRFSKLPVDIRLVDEEDVDLFREPCDILSPNALGGVLNPQTIPFIQAKIVCGGANNQLLEDDRDANALATRNIVYVPDFVANRMGIVRCANEQYGTLPADPAIQRHFDETWENSVHVVTHRILEHAQRQNTTPTHAANALADALSEELHPIWGHRSRIILDSLMADRWHLLG
jgi:glutamate dehydrogenase/leucine dehydrogenase